MYIESREYHYLWILRLEQGIFYLQVGPIVRYHHRRTTNLKII